MALNKSVEKCVHPHIAYINGPNITNATIADRMMQMLHFLFSIVVI